MTKKLYSILAFLMVAAMLLAACQPAATEEPTPVPTEEVMATEEPTEPPTEAPTEPVMTEEPTEAPMATEEPTEPAMVDALVTPYPQDQLSEFGACQVTDVGGIDDRSFNATAWQGVQDAVDEFGIQGDFLESQQQADYEENLNAFLDAECNLIITVGFLLGDATAAAAEANPEQPFTIVDFAYDPTIPNVLGQVFNTQEAAFLAGYVAAGTTQTGTVATFGGLQIPPVTVFMDGFVLGVRYYNEQNDANVQVLGWDPEAQTGLFVGNFESTEDGRTMGLSLMDEGADIIMPVAGPVGLGTAAAAQQRGNVYIIGVDTDWTQTSPEYTDLILTSVLKKMDVTTLAAIESVIDGTFEGGVVVGTLENEGVEIAPFYDLAELVPDPVEEDLDSIRQGIISGEISATP